MSLANLSSGVLQFSKLMQEADLSQAEEVELVALAVAGGVIRTEDSGKGGIWNNGTRNNGIME